MGWKGREEERSGMGTTLCTSCDFYCLQDMTINIDKEPSVWCTHSDSRTQQDHLRFAAGGKPR